MGVSVKTEWIDRYNADQEKLRVEKRARRTQTAMFSIYATAQAAAIGVIYSLHRTTAALR
jgi:hypothetical protein